VAQLRIGMRTSFLIWSTTCPLSQPADALEQQRVVFSLSSKIFTVPGTPWPGIRASGLRLFNQLRGA